MREINKKKKRTKAIRMTLALVLAFAMVISMNMSYPAGLRVWAGTEGESVLEPGDEGSTGETADEETESPDLSEDADKETADDADAADAEQQDSADETTEEAPEGASGETPENTTENTSESTSETEPVSEDPLDALDNILIAPAAVDAGDFSVEGPEGRYSFADGVLTITGDVTVSMKDGVTSTSNRIVIESDAEVTIKDISIAAEGAPAILVQAPANAVLTLEGKNTVLGGNGKNVNHISGSYAGIEVGWVSHDEMASLTIKGDGELDAKGGPNSAAIGGSKNSNGVYGNITIDNGTIVAESGETDEWAGGAGIGSSDNPNNGTSSGSYKHTEDSWGTITINGGNITATGGYNAAGIGGGNHCDSGKIIITGGTIDAKGHTGIGSGYGSSQTTSKTDLTKGPGYYFADIEISGGTITATAWSTGSTNDGGAGIGGGMYSDAKITITGGTITATGGNGKGLGSYHHGGSGIGGGYEGHAEVTITGGTIIANGGGAAAGIGSGAIPNQNMENAGSQGYKCRAGETTIEYTDINITGGNVTATGGVSGGAGIGGGVGADRIAIAIEGGDITATGGEGSKDKLKYKENGSPYAGGNGGAGIGSGYSGTTSGESSYYFETTDSLDIKITDGKVLAVGGWGASGIGSGADNTTATSIEIDATKADIEAYADGTKFAVDTRALSDNGLDTKSIADGRTITGDMLQGTFVQAYVSEDGVNQGTEGLNKIVVTNDVSEESETLTKMPAGYRSFAIDVNGAGTYTVFTDSDAVAKGGGRFFNKCTDDYRTEEDVRTAHDIVERKVQYTAKNGELCDNFYLFPVKSIVVSKKVEADKYVKEGLTQTLKFALWQGGEDGHYVKDPDDPSKIWMQTIEVAGGVPQSKAYFINVDEGTYAIWELDENGNEMKKNTPVPGHESIILVDITTRHGDTDDNDATIGPDVDTDYVTVINKYERKEDIGIKITKTISNYFDANDGAGNNTANATFIFKVQAYGAEETDLLYENYVSVTFDKYGEPQSDELEIKGVSGIETITVTEVYGAGYEADEAEQTISLTGDDAAEMTEDGYYEFEFTNTYGDKIVEGSGVLNRYQNKSYTEPDAEQEPAA